MQKGQEPTPGSNATLHSGPNQKQSKKQPDSTILPEQPLLMVTPLTSASSSAAKPKPEQKQVDDKCLSVFSGTEKLINPLLVKNYRKTSELHRLFLAMCALEKEFDDLEINSGYKYNSKRAAKYRQHILPGLYTEAEGSPYLQNAVRDEINADWQQAKAHFSVEEKKFSPPVQPLNIMAVKTVKRENIVAYYEKLSIETASAITQAIKVYTLHCLILQSEGYLFKACYYPGWIEKLLDQLGPEWKTTLIHSFNWGKNLPQALFFYDNSMLEPRGKSADVSKKGHEIFRQLFSTNAGQLFAVQAIARSPTDMNFSFEEITADDSALTPSKQNLSYSG